MQKTIVAAASTFETNINSGTIWCLASEAEEKTLKAKKCQQKDQLPRVQQFVLVQREIVSICYTQNEAQELVVVTERV